MRLRKLSKRDKFYPSVKYELLTKEQFNVDIPYNLKSNKGLIVLQDGVLTANPGYLFDGPSGPAIDTADALWGSLPHDALFEMMRKGKLPQSIKVQADKLLETTMMKHKPAKRSWLKDKWLTFRDHYFYKAVRLFGKRSAALITDGNEVIEI